jgi:hypothetical protein
MESDFFSAAVWWALGLQEPFSPRVVPGTGSYPGQQREVCLAGCFFVVAIPRWSEARGGGVACTEAIRFS